MSKRNLLILGALVLALVWFLAARRRAAPPVVADEPETVERVPVSNEPSKFEALEKKLGMKTGKVQVSSDSIYFDVVLSPLRRCGPGDLDIIQLDIKHRQDDRLWLEVLPLNGDSPVDGVAVAGSRLESGFHHVFHIPRKDALQSFGLYLCADASKSKTCRGKRVVNPNRFFQAYLVFDKQPPVEPESVYFYQLVNFHDDTIAVFAKGIVDKEAYRLLPEYLGSSVGGAASEATKLVRTNTTTVGSLPVQLGLSTRIDLPLHDIGLCKRGRH